MSGAATIHLTPEGIQPIPADTTLQEAYDAAVAVPQITIDGTPNPLTIDASVTGDIFAIRDVANSDLMRIATDGSEIYGGIGSGDELRLRGSTHAGLGIVGIDSPVEIDVDLGVTVPLAGYPISWNTSFSPPALIGGMITDTGTVTVTAGTFIWALLSENRVYSMGVNPGFAAFTLFNVLPVIQNLGNFNLLTALVLNNGVRMARITSGTSTYATMSSISHSTIMNPTVSGAVVTATTGQQGLVFQPKWNSPAGTTINFGTLIGLQCVEPINVLFGASAGTRNMTAYIGLDFPNFTFFTGTQIINVVRSALNSGTNRRFLNHTGNAVSTVRGQVQFDVDLVGIAFGASLDWQTGWGGAGFYFEQQNAPNPIGQFRKSFPSTTRMLMDWSVNMELTINAQLGFSLGAQSGANGNQFGNFVAGAQTVTVGGEYSQFLLTQAGNVTVDAALSGLFGWTVNAPSITLGTGTVTTAGALNIGGNVNQGSVNRFGVRILSNPSGGSGVNAALWVTAGLTRLDGRLDINQPIALGGGAAATLGTIGGTGPTAAAQAQWVEIDINGVAHWIPAWT